MLTPLRPCRPRSVTLVLLSVFALGIWNGGRAIALFLQLELLLAMNSLPNPTVRLGIDLVWAGLFFGVAIGVWRKRPFVPHLLPKLIGLYALYNLLLHRLYAQATYNTAQWLLSGLLYILFITTTQWILTKNKQHFNESTTLKRGDT